MLFFLMDLARLVYLLLISIIHSISSAKGYCVQRMGQVWLRSTQRVGNYKSKSLKSQKYDRDDWFEAFVHNRNWQLCEAFWSKVMRGIVKSNSAKLPDFIMGACEGETAAGDPKYGVTNLRELYDAGMKGEFVSKDNRYLKRQTFALRIGYDGLEYYGYQMQKKCPGRTVEGDLKESLGRNTIGAGRTDRGVSAVSQVICFPVSDMNISADEILTKLRASEPVKSGRIAAFDCQRVPKSFNSRSSATWRRYLYLFPLSVISSAEPNTTDSLYDVDIEYLNKILGRYYLFSILLPAFKEVLAWLCC